jgi:membrane dipeptidase
MDTVLDLSRARALIDSTFAWDNHACLPLRPHETEFFPHLKRHKDAGFDAVNVNIGFGETGIEEHVRMVSLLRHWLKQHAEDYVLLDEVDDIASLRASGKLGVGFDIEGANGIGDQLSLVEMYRDLGVRWMSMAYNLNNRVGGGCQDEDPGLTPFGRDVVAEMERVGMLVCVSHTGHRTARDVFDVATKPVIFSHSNCTALHAHPRNIPDDLIRACAQSGGVVGLNGVGIFLGHNDAASETYARHVDHVVQLVGPRHACISLDFVFDMSELEEYMATMKHTFPPGLGYEEGMRFVAPEQLAEIVAVLQKWGYEDDDLRAILGGNLLRLARETDGR